LTSLADRKSLGNAVAFDPSLIRLSSISFFEELADEHDVRFVVSNSMKKVLTNWSDATSLLELWEANHAEARAVSKYIIEKSIAKRFDVVELKDERQYLYSKILEREIYRHITKKRPLIKFLADEILLGLDGYPIFATASSSWSIVEKLRQIKCNVREPVLHYFGHKAQLLKLKSARKKIIASGLGAVLVFVLGGPLALAGAVGVGAINAIVVDP